MTSPGNKATFLVGGEIPVVTSTGLGAVNVQYQPYGVQLNVTPSILGNGSVHAVIAPQISALDYANAVIVSGFTIPALTVSQLSTDVITRPGESILLGGLVQRLERRTISKIPLLSDIPILGKLFTSTAYQNFANRRGLRDDAGDHHPVKRGRQRGTGLGTGRRLPRRLDGLWRNRRRRRLFGVPAAGAAERNRCGRHRWSAAARSIELHELSGGRKPPRRPTRKATVLPTAAT